MMSASRLGCAALVAALFGSALFTREAHANGRFPATNQLVVDPSDPDHLVLGVTFGLLESRDGGLSFSWTCERVLGLIEQEDPVIVLSDVGTTVVATFNGIVTTHDGCGYAHDADLEGEIIPDLTRSAGVSGQLFAFRTVGLPEGHFDSQLLRSDDGGESWKRLEPPLADDILPLTIEVAKSDPSRIYLTAREGREAGYSSVLLRSEDGGESFDRFTIPGTENQKLAFIGAVHPTDSDRVYVRIDDAATVILTSSDGGETFEPLFTGAGRLLGFGLSPDGNTIAVGGPSDGIWMSGADTEILERRSDVRPTCLRYSGDTLYACSTKEQSGFLLGRSTDLGHTFEPMLTFESLCGSTACGPDTNVGEQCAADWVALAPRLGSTCGAGGSAQGGAPGSAGAPAEAGAAPEPEPTPPHDDGGCVLGAAPAQPTRALILSFALLAVRCKRRRRSAQPRP